MTRGEPEWLKDYNGPFLIDTHVLLWSFLEPERLSLRIRRILEEGNHPIQLSTVTAWEILLKTRKGQLPFRDPVKETLEMAQTLGAHWRDISIRDILVLSYLPELHKDPFDRLLLAQAMQSATPLATADAKIWQYEQIPIPEMPAAWTRNLIW
jgi:PIN domain nuclease of toxin-antitoxin system